MGLDGVTFPEARMVLDRIGFVAPLSAPIARPTRSPVPNEDEIDCMTLMGELFHRFLLHSTLGRPARQYLFGTRGITGLHLNALLPSMGYAPEQYMADMQQVLRKRFGKGWHQLAESTGFLRGERESLHERLVFLVRNDSGHIVFYQARTITGSEPKFLNPSFRKTPFAPLRYPFHPGTFVVEGPMDTIAVAAQGFYTVGIFGSVLPTISEIKRWPQPIFGGLDHDCNSTGQDTQAKLATLCRDNAIPYQDWDWAPHKDPAEALETLRPSAFTHLLSGHRAA